MVRGERSHPAYYAQEGARSRGAKPSRENKRELGENNGMRVGKAA
jgi:hypothetical protein